jgi:hypothetical protein
MEATISESGITGRVIRVELKANSFEEERLLRMIVNGIADGGTLFELSRNGEPKGAFTFNNSRREEGVDNG